MRFSPKRRIYLDSPDLLPMAENNTVERDVLPEAGKPAQRVIEPRQDQMADGDELKRRFVWNFKKFRNGKGSVEKIAADCGISQSTARTWSASGVTRIDSGDDFQRLCDRIDVEDPTDFWNPIPFQQPEVIETDDLSPWEKDALIKCRKLLKSQHGSALRGLLDMADYLIH